MWCEPGQSAGEATLDTESPNVLGANTVYGTTSLPGFSDGRGSLPPAAGDFQAGVRKAKTPAVEVPALPTQQKCTVPRPQVSPATFAPKDQDQGPRGSIREPTLGLTGVSQPVRMSSSRVQSKDCAVTC